MPSFPARPKLRPPQALSMAGRTAKFPRTVLMASVLRRLDGGYAIRPFRLSLCFAARDLLPQAAWHRSLAAKWCPGCFAIEPPGLGFRRTSNTARAPDPVVWVVGAQFVAPVFVLSMAIPHEPYPSPKLEVNHDTKATSARVSACGDSAIRWSIVSGGWPAGMLAAGTMYLLMLRLPDSWTGPIAGAFGAFAGIVCLVWMIACPLGLAYASFRTIQASRECDNPWQRGASRDASVVNVLAWIFAGAPSLFILLFWSIAGS